MRIYTPIGLICLVLTSSAWAQQIFPYPYQCEVLENHLTVITIPMPSSGLVAYYSIVRTGSRDEVEAGKTGFAHFFEHMMFRGTPEIPAAEYERILSGIGANANAYTTDDYTAYHLNFAKEDLETVIKVESDRFQHLDYSEAAFQTEAGAIYGEFRKGQTSPFFLLEEKLKNLAYTRHTYQHTTIGFEADVKAMPEGYAYSRSFFKRFYRPDNVVLLIVGDIDSDATQALVNKYYGDWQAGYTPPKVMDEPPQTQERTGEVTYPGRTLPILSVAYHGARFDPEDREYVAARLLGELAFGSSSDLYKQLVLQEQKVEFISADIPMNRDMPLFEIDAMIKRPEDIDAVREQILKTVARFQEQPPEAQKLEQVQRRNKYAFLMSLDEPDHVAGHLARIVALTGGINAIEQLYATQSQVTPEDVQQAARKYFQPNRRTIVVLKGAAS